MNLYSGDGDDEKDVILTVEAGQCFGDVEFFMGMDFRMVHAKPVDECTVFILDYQAAKDIFERFEDSETDKFMKDAKEKYEIILKKTKNSGRKNTIMNK